MRETSVKSSLALLAGLVLMLGLTSCGTAKIGDNLAAQNENPASLPDSQKITSTRELKSLPDVSKLSGGMLIFQPPDSLDLDSVDGYVVGYPDTLKVEATNENRFFISNIPVGNWSVFITGKKKSGESVAKIFNALSFLQSNITTVDVISLETAITVTKNFGIFDIDNLAPISNVGIEISGTNLGAKEIQKGQYQIENIPAGKFTLNLKREGFRNGVFFETDSASIQKQMFLSSSTHSNFIIETSEGNNPKEPGEKFLVVSPPDDGNGPYTEMRFAPNGDISEGSWTPIRSSFSWTFNSARDYNFKLQFRKTGQNPALSEIFQKQFRVGTQFIYPSNGGYAVAGVGDNLILAGGFNLVKQNGTQTYFNVPQTTVKIFNSKTYQWQTANLGSARIPVSASNDKFAIFVGNNGAPSDLVDLYDSGTTSWSTYNLNTARNFSEIAVYNDKFIIAGGESVFSNVAEIFNPSSGSWEYLILPEARARIKLEVCGNKIFFAGGYYPSTLFSNRIDIFDVAQNTWIQMNLNEPKQIGTATKTDSGSLVLVGGYNQSGVVSSAEIINCQNLEKSVIQLPTGLMSASSFSEGDLIHVIGGNTNTNSSSTRYIINTKTLKIDSFELPHMTGTFGKVTKFKNSFIFSNLQLFDSISKEWSIYLY